MISEERSLRGKVNMAYGLLGGFFLIAGLGLLVGNPGVLIGLGTWFLVIWLGQTVLNR
jgi:hypothetical protein